MRLKKIIALFCAFLMIFTVMPNVVYAADITALDLSENKTHFTTVGEEGTLIVYVLTGAETARARDSLIDNSLLEFASSNDAVIYVDENGGFRINAEGINNVHSLVLTENHLQEAIKLPYSCAISFLYEKIYPTLNKKI